MYNDHTHSPQSPMSPALEEFFREFKSLIDEERLTHFESIDVPKTTTAREQKESEETNVTSEPRNQLTEQERQDRALVSKSKEEKEKQEDIKIAEEKLAQEGVNIESEESPQNILKVYNDRIDAARNSAPNKMKNVNMMSELMQTVHIGYDEKKGYNMSLKIPDRLLNEASTPLGKQIILSINPDARIEQDRIIFDIQKEEIPRIVRNIELKFSQEEITDTAKEREAFHRKHGVEDSNEQFFEGDSVAKKYAADPELSRKLAVIKGKLPEGYNKTVMGRVIVNTALVKDGNDTVMLVPKKYAAEFRQLREMNHFPGQLTKDSSGNYAIKLDEKGVKKFLKEAQLFTKGYSAELSDESYERLKKVHPELAEDLKARFAKKERDYYQDNGEGVEGNNDANEDLAQLQLN